MHSELKTLSEESTTMLPPDAPVESLDLFRIDDVAEVVNGVTYRNAKGVTCLARQVPVDMAESMLVRSFSAARLSGSVEISTEEAFFEVTGRVAYKVYIDRTKEPAVRYATAPSR